MKFIDLDPQYQRLKASINKRIAAVLEHQQFIHGPEEKELELALAKRVGVKHCIGMANGTVASQVALMALDIGPGDEVITTAFSFFATVEVIMLQGATPVLVDIDPRTYNLNVDKLEQAITSKTKAIMPVSLYGQSADMDAINEIAKQYGLPVIEDAAQSFGATYKGRESCSLTTIGCTSFFPSKSLGCYGDGGACFTNDDALAERMRLLIHHGEKTRYNHVELGMNGRLDTLQAAILLAKLEIFDEEIEQRQKVAAWYGELLSDHFVTPIILPENKSVFAQYTVRVDDREKLREKLAQNGIPTAVHYPNTMAGQAAFLNRYGKKHFPEAELAARQVLSLPFYPAMTKNKVELVAQELVQNVLLV